MKKKILKFFRSFIFKILYGKIYLEYKNYHFPEIEIKESNNKIFDTSQKYFTYSVKNGTVYTNNVQHVAAISNNYLFAPASFQHANNKIINSKKNIVLKEGTPNIKKNFSGTVLSLVQGASGENYFHWLLDIIPKIKICMNNYDPSEIKYFYLPPLKSSQLESLKLIGINKKKIINSKIYKHINADKIIFVTHPWYYKGKFHDQSWNLPSWIILWIRNIFLKHKKKFKCSKKILIDRSESNFNHCQIINKKQLESFLIKNGFKIYRIGEYNFVKQIFMFWNAKFIIGAHGAAFTNLIFCKPNTKIIEFKPFNHPGRNYEKISKINKLNYQKIISKKKYLKNTSGDIFVDLNILKKKLKFR